MISLLPLAGEGARTADEGSVPSQKRPHPTPLPQVGEGLQQNGNAMLKIDNLHARVANREILKGLSLDVKPKWRLCQRENALSAENPSKSATSARRRLLPSR